MAIDDNSDTDFLLTEEDLRYDRAFNDQPDYFWLKLIAAAALIAIIAATAYYFKVYAPHQEALKLAAAEAIAETETEPVPTPEPEPEVQLPSAPVPTPEAVVRFPFPADLPALDSSDAELREQLPLLFDESQRSSVSEWLTKNDLARKFTTVVYNLSDGAIAYRFLPLPQPEKSFATRASSGKTYIDESNFARYTPYVDVLESLDIEHAAAFYAHYWPLFKRAFGELGESRKSLHSEAILGLDLMLDTPTPEGPLRLVRPSVYYKFADADIEALRPSQKLLLRMGPDNRATVETVLRGVRKALVPEQEPATTAEAPATTLKGSGEVLPQQEQSGTVLPEHELPDSE